MQLRMIQVCIIQNSIMNPFQFGKVVTGQDFCTRPALVDALRSCIEDGHNIAVLGERRTGKTSLIFETARKIRGLRLIYAQLWAVNSVEDVATRLLRGVATMQSDDSLLEKAARSLASLRPRIEFDEMSGKPTVTVAAGTRLAPSGLHAVFDLIENVATRQRIAVALDEFQDIQRLSEADAVLGEVRGRIQRQRKVPYIFAGSIRHAMERIFRDPSSPFFKALRTINVPGLPRPEFQRFLDHRFREGKRKVQPALYERIFALAEDNPSDVQQFCAALWDTSRSGETVSEESIVMALRHIFATERKGYEALARNLTGNQINCLRALARIGGGRPQSKEFLREAGISLPASAKRAITRLVNLEIIYGVDLQHKFFDPFFKQWVLHEL
jgi:hypothetical protein